MTSDTVAEEEPATTTPRINPAVRLWHRFRALGTGHKLTVVGLVVAGVPVVTPWITAAYDALFGDDAAMVMYVEQGNDTCFTSWMLAPGQQNLRKAVVSADNRVLNRWDREGKITHRDTVDAAISVRGNADKAVQIRDVAITVTRRDQPLAGTQIPQEVCGGGDGPEILVVDLDTLPLNHRVSGRYLLTSPQQEEARKAAEAHAPDRSPLSLPQEITTGGVYDLLLVGRTQSHYCEWKATITWWDGKEIHTTDVDNNGTPFRVSATAQ